MTILERPNSILLFIGRLVICFVLLYIIYFFYGPVKDVEVETINEILYLFVIPIILIPLTIAICLIVGLPIRLSSKIYNWWLSNSYIAFIGLTLGFIIILLSPNFTNDIEIVENGIQTYKDFPNETILGTGWFVTAFFLLHFYPIRFIENIIDKFKKNKNEFDWTNKW